jgi:hypothetical protein
MLRRLQKPAAPPPEAPLLAELSALRAELQADREAFNAMRQRFELEMDAQRAELQAERAAFMAALEQLRHQDILNRQPPPSARDLERLVNTVDAALVTLVLNNQPAQ